VHKDRLVHTVPEDNTACFVKDTMQARMAWRGKIDVASQRQGLAKANRRRHGKTSNTHSSHRQECADAMMTTSGASDISGMDLRGCGLLEVVMDKIQMNEVLFDRALMERASLVEVSGSYCTFYDALMSQSNLHKSNLAYSTFSGADLSGSDLGFVICIECILHRTILDGALLNDGNFLSAEFDDADLTNVNAFKADFSKASFRNTVFRGAELSLASFVEADVAGADFQDARISATELVGAKNVHLATGLTFQMPPP